MKLDTIDVERVQVLKCADTSQQRFWFRHALESIVSVSPRETIAIKPNLGSPLPAGTGATTELWMIEETVNYIRRRGGHPIVVAGPSHIHDFEQVLQVTGASALFRALGVAYVDARSEPAELPPLHPGDDNQLSYFVSESLLKADGVICLPKLKTHNRTGTTLGIKNLMGLLSFNDRHDFHRRGVSDDIVELYRRLKGRIRATFVDGVVAMEGHGPTNGQPVMMNVIVAGTDMVAVDSICSQMMGFDAEEVEHVRKAHELGFGNMRSDWQMHPANLPLPVRMFRRPNPDSGLRTKIITFPVLSSLLRSQRMGVRGRTKPVLISGGSVHTCETCSNLCPTGAIDTSHRIRYKACIGCGLCIAECPQKALAPEGRQHKLRRVFQELSEAG